ncbi:MAG: hypothetical protein NXI27_30900 [Alphaproteobacteria bacterium]|nr:hypothetical protein [Alphaproteobacteria bacterium]
MSELGIPFNKPSLVGREIDYLHEAIERGQLSGDGHFTRLCSQRLVDMTGSDAALLTHSCTVTWKGRSMPSSTITTTTDSTRASAT